MDRLIGNSSSALPLMMPCITQREWQHLAVTCTIAESSRLLTSNGVPQQEKLRNAGADGAPQQRKLRSVGGDGASHRKKLRNASLIGIRTEQVIRESKRREWEPLTRMRRSIER
jgi:hypothetical protein